VISEFIVPAPPPALPYTSFTAVTLPHASGHILSLSKSSPVDTIPVCFLKACPTSFSGFLTELANRSFQQGKFPNAYKAAQITPLLKKSNLNPCDLSSYRPISNLSTMGKVLGRLVQDRIRLHLSSSLAFSPYQSAYRPGYSTETASLKIVNDLFKLSDSGAPFLRVF